MSAGFAPARALPRDPWPVLAPLMIAVVAILGGLAVGDATNQWRIYFGVACGIWVIYAAVRWPFAGLLVLIASTIELVVVSVTASRGLNAFDVLVPTVFLTSAFGMTRRDALAQTRSETGPAHERLRVAERRFLRAVILFYVCAGLSLVRLAMLAGVGQAIDSGFLLARNVEGLLLYPLCTWWLLSQQRVNSVWTAIAVAGLVLCATNFVGVGLMNVHRAGLSFTVNNPDHIADPNEAATATLIVAVVLLVRQAMRPDWKNLVLGALMVIILGMSQSRSGLMAWVTFGLMTLRYVKPSRLFTGGLAVAGLFALLPAPYWIRLGRSLGTQRGTNEAVSFFERVYGWETAWRTFLDQPMGVGYLGFRFVSYRYNVLHLIISTVENYFFEILVSMGVVGLVLLAVIIVRLLRIGREIGQLAPPGTLAHHMARFHTPLVLGLLIANMTGNNFAGMVGLGQLAVWTAVLVRAGHAAIATEGRA